MTSYRDPGGVSGTTSGFISFDVDGPVDGKRSVRYHLTEAPSPDILHRDERPALVLIYLMDRADVRVVKRRRGLRLAQEALSRLLVAAELGGEELQRDGPRPSFVSSAR